jgi:hypothetical protein
MPRQTQPVTSQGDTSSDASGAPPINKADDHAGTFEYRDLPDSEKPAPETVAQEQVLPSDK